MPNTYTAFKYLVQNQKKKSFLLVPLNSLFDGRLSRYNYDLEMISHLHKMVFLKEN